MTRTVTSNKDGERGRRGETFMWAYSGTYSIYDDGTLVGIITKMPDVRFKSPAYVWNVSVVSGPGAGAYQYFADAKAAATGGSPSRPPA